MKIPNGELRYTRSGSFRRDEAGQIVTAEGYRLENAPAIPSDACTSDTIFKTFFDRGEEGVSQRPELDSHLGYEVLKALRKHARYARLREKIRRMKVDVE